MSSSPPTGTPAATFICECEDFMRPSCKGLPRYATHGDGEYCVLHFPGPKEGAEFDAALKKKLADRDFNFAGVWFYDKISFERLHFTGDVNFNYATFRAGANFMYAEFGGGASFSNTFFGGKALFGEAVFNKSAFFLSATFDAAADFSRTAFYGATDFSFATFNGHAKFVGGQLSDGSPLKVFDERDEVSLRLHAATVEPHAVLSFHAVRLRPHWFINVDARRFEFSNVDWGWRQNSTKREIKCTRKVDTSAPHRLLGSACRDLAVNAEEDHRYEEASRLRYMAMEALRLERWHGLAVWTLGWWYWLASGYGERAGKAFLWLIGIMVLSTALYVRLGYPNWETRATPERPAAAAPRQEVVGWQQWSGALLYSGGVMMLQKPEPRPATDAAQMVVLLETIFGPVQAALLALAIRRKFMR